MEVFYRLNPAKMLRYQPYMKEWLRQHHSEMTEAGWVNGAYTGYVVSSALSKGRKYPQEPVNFWETIPTDPEEQAAVDADRFAAFAAMFNKRWEATHKAEEQTPG